MKTNISINAAGRRLVVTGLSLASILTVCAQQEKTVTLASLDWEPYIGTKLPKQGCVAQIATEAFKTQGYQVKIDFLPWARAVASAKEGTHDGLFPEYYDEERLKDFVYSQPFKGGPVGFLKRKDAKITYATLEDLKPYKIGVVRGYVNTVEFDKATYLKKEEVDADLQNLKKLNAGRLDLIVIDKYVASYLAKQELGADAVNFEFLSPPLEEKSLYIAFSKKAPDSAAKLSAFNKGLEAITKSGRLAELLKTLE